MRLELNSPETHPNLPSKQRVEGSNPSGTASISKRFQERLGRRANTLANSLQGTQGAASKGVNRLGAIGRRPKRKGAGERP